MTSAIYRNANGANKSGYDYGHLSDHSATSNPLYSILIEMIIYFGDAFNKNRIQSFP